MCRQLNVFSKTTNSEVSFRSWDLDIIQRHNKWLVSKSIPYWYSSLDKKISLSDHGTLVLWKECDRLAKKVDIEKKIQEVREELNSHI